MRTRTGDTYFSGGMHMMTFGEHEKPRSMQLCDVDPKTKAEAVRISVGEGLADHIDSNFDCPMSTL